MSPSAVRTGEVHPTEPSVAPLRLPALEQAIAEACARLAIPEAYLAALREPVPGAAPSLLLAVSGTDAALRRRLAAEVADALPDTLEMRLLELAEDALSQVIRQRCEAFYRA